MRNSKLRIFYKLLFILLILISNINSFAQSALVYTQYPGNRFLLNPASTGQEDYAHIQTGIKFWNPSPFQSGIPVSAYATAHSSIRRSSRRPHPVRNKIAGYHSIGGIVYEDQGAIYGKTGGVISYAFSLHLFKSNWRLAVGGAFGGYRFSDRGFKRNLNVTESEIPKEVIPEGSFGFRFSNRHTYLDVSILQLIPYTFSNSIPGSPKQMQIHKSSPVYLLGTGTKLYITTHFNLEPFVLIKYHIIHPLIVDMNLKSQFKDMVWMVLSWKNQEIFGLLLGCLINKQWEFQYGYELPQHSNVNVTNTHEFTVAKRIWPRCVMGTPANFW